jgi:hypothetical protein
MENTTTNGEYMLEVLQTTKQELMHQNAHDPQSGSVQLINPKPLNGKTGQP